MKGLVFLGYCTSCNLRLYRKDIRNSVHVYLIPLDVPLEHFRDFEISKDLALYLSNNVLRYTL